jgi:hypothetical protein
MQSVNNFIQFHNSDRNKTATVSYQRPRYQRIHCTKAKMTIRPTTRAIAGLINIEAILIASAVTISVARNRHHAFTG